MLNKLLFTLIWILTASLLLAGQCAGNLPQSDTDSATFKVVVTTSIVGDVVQNVGGNMIEITQLLPTGTDPHTFEPTPRDLATVAEADIIFANGLGLEAFLDEMLKNAGGQAVTVHVSEGIETRQLVRDTDHDAAEEHEEEHRQEDEAEAGHEDEHNHEGADPHTWTSPANVLIFVDNIERALTEHDPAHAEQYAANATAYRAQLKELDSWVKTQIEKIPADNRELVTDHTAFGYYADQYGLTQVGAIIPSFSAGAGTSAKELAALEESIEAYNVKAIFVGTTVNSAVAEQLAQDIGVKILPLYTGSLGLPGSGVETYRDYIEFNTNTIVEGLR